jgi:hypothetical protein
LKEDGLQAVAAFYGKHEQFGLAGYHFIPTIVSNRVPPLVISAGMQIFFEFGMGSGVPTVSLRVAPDIFLPEGFRKAVVFAISLP